MQGRLENTIKREDKIKKKLETLPSYTSDFYYNIVASGLTSASCLDMITKIQALHNWLKDNNVEIKDVTESVMTKYLHEKNKKITTSGEEKATSYSYKKTLISCFKKYFTYLLKKKVINQNPMKDIALPHHKDEIKRKKLTVENMNDVIKNIKNYKTISEEKDCDYRWSDRDMLIISLLINTGMRATALSEINVSDVNMDAKEIIVTDKRDKKHIYILNDGVMEILKEWLEDRNELISEAGAEQSDALFITKFRKRIGYASIYNIVKKYTGGIVGDCGVSPHKFRSALVTLLYDKTHDIEFVRRVIGHEYISTTQRYIIDTDNVGVRKKANEIISSLTEF